VFLHVIVNVGHAAVHVGLIVVWVVERSMMLVNDDVFAVVRLGVRHRFD
jgi:hypothetical protein